MTTNKDVINEWLNCPYCEDDEQEPTISDDTDFEHLVIECHYCGTSIKFYTGDYNV